MNAILGFPALLDIDQMAAPTMPPVLQAVEKTNAITTGIANVQSEVAKFDQIATGLKALEDAHPKNVIVAAINTPAGMKQAETSWRAYRNPRLEVERARKAAKAPVLALGRAVDEFAAGLETRLRDGEDHYKSQIDSENNRKAAEQAERERIEQEELDKFNARLRAIRTYATRCQEPGMTAERIATGMKTLESFDVSDQVPARAVELADAKCRTLEDMRVMHAQATGREQEAARQEAIRAENERVARELAAERERIAAELAEIRRQADELAAARAEYERLEALAVANRERLARQAEEDRLAAAAFAALKEAKHAEAIEPERIQSLGDALGAVVAGMVIDRAAVITYGPEVQKFAADVMEAIRPDDPDAAPPMTVEEMGAETVDRDDALTQMEDECRVIDPFGDELRALIAEARASRFPSQPKMGLEWWARFYALVELRAAQTA